MLKLYRVYQAYYMTHQLSDQEPSRIAWIGSLQFYLVFSAGVLGGPLFDRYGAKVGTITDSDPCPPYPYLSPYLAKYYLLRHSKHAELDAV